MRSFDKYNIFKAKVIYILNIKHMSPETMRDNCEGVCLKKSVNFKVKRRCPQENVKVINDNQRFNNQHQPFFVDQI